MPVILPLGRARDATKPHLTGILGECRRRSGGLLCRPRPQGGEAPRRTRFSTAGGSKLQLVSCSSNAKGLAAGLAPTSGQVVTQIQSASPRPVSAVRILYAQPRSPVSARQKVNVARTMASERARGCCCACFVFALQWKPLIAQRVGGGVVGLLSPLGQQGGRSETMAC